mmetsp:Transcript_35562/g.100135  ORF Transcript_35562/g.100135 Transcript_35562/m.100135 type:complete len:374 (+) Transcript_35562:2-1123(+)
MYLVDGTSKPELRAVVAQTLVTTVRIASGTGNLSSHLQDLVGAVYLGMHDPEKDIAKKMTDVWEDVFALQGGKRANFSEIQKTISEGLQSPSWFRKAQAAAALVAFCQGTHPSKRALVENSLAEVLELVPGRTWEGKDTLYAALSKLVLALHSMQEPRPSLRQMKYGAQVLETLVQESERRKPTYRLKAVTALAELTKAVVLEPCDVSIVIKGLLPALFFDKSSYKTDEESDGKTLPVLLLVSTQAWTTLQNMFTTSPSTASEVPTDELLQKLAANFPTFVWTVKAAAARFVKALAKCTPPSAVDDQVLAVLVKDACDSKYPAVQEQVWAAIKEVVFKNRSNDDFLATAKASLQQLLPLDLLRQRVSEFLASL